ncbi:hypothetical protein LZ31DRAFT_84496 [Colletotrichum somersetense]|nr:hypothetical protein LZ31DRAFT_84496 [Colletotrichum somersetense]
MESDGQRGFWTRGKGLLVRLGKSERRWRGSREEEGGILEGFICECPSPSALSSSWPISGWNSSHLPLGTSDPDTVPGPAPGQSSSFCRPWFSPSPTSCCRPWSQCNGSQGCDKSSRGCWMSFEASGHRQTELVVSLGSRFCFVLSRACNTIGMICCIPQSLWKCV